MPIRPIIYCSIENDMMGTSGQMNCLSRVCDCCLLVLFIGCRFSSRLTLRGINQALASLVPLRSDLMEGYLWVRSV